MKEMEYKNALESHSYKEVLDSGEYKGFRYWIVSFGTHPCAYVEIPSENTLYGKTYRVSSTGGIAVHGGITYSSGHLDLGNEAIEDTWIIGWDYCHSTDYTGIMPYSGGKKWTTAEMLDDVHAVIEQIIEINKAKEESE